MAWKANLGYMDEEALKVKRPMKCYGKRARTDATEDQFRSTQAFNMAALCRICLFKDRRMHSIVDTDLQRTYEFLTTIPLVKEGRPLQVCYICCARLRNCYQLQATCLQSEKLLAQMIKKKQLQPLLKDDSMQIVHPLTIWDNISEDPNISDIKTEPPEEMDDTLQVKMEFTEDDIENQDNGHFIESINQWNFNSGNIEDNNAQNSGIQTLSNYNQVYPVELQHNIKTKPSNETTIQEKISVRSEENNGLNSNVSLPSTSNNSILLSNVNTSHKINTNDPVHKKSKSAEHKDKQNIADTNLRNNNQEVGCQHNKTLRPDESAIPINNANMLNKVEAQNKLYECDLCRRGFDLKCNFNLHLSIAKNVTSVDIVE